MIKKLFPMIIVISIAFSFLSGCIEENKDPYASFIFEPAEIELNTTITALSTSTDEDGEIVNTTWFWNYEIVGYGQNFSFNIIQNGSYILKLTVIDDDESSCSVEEMIMLGNYSKEVKELLLGTWAWEGEDQTGTWVFFQNNTLKSTFLGAHGASVVDFWEYFISNLELCFKSPSNDKLMDACYVYSFSEDNSVLTVTYEGISADWVKVD